MIRYTVERKFAWGWHPYVFNGASCDYQSPSLAAFVRDYLAEWFPTWTFRVSAWKQTPLGPNRTRSVKVRRPSKATTRAAR